MYFSEGFWLLIQSILPAVIIYALISVVLCLLKKRNIEFYKSNKLKTVGECLFLFFIFVILRITGITDGTYYCDGFDRISAIEIGIPFSGASELLVFLNTIMFVPFGFFAAMAFKKLSWLKAFLLSFGTTFIIEFLQLYNGRKSELDDIIANVFGAMCGYFIFKGIEALIKKKNRKRGVITLAAVLLISGLYTATVHFLANGDRVQSEIDDMYHEIYNIDDDNNYDCIEKMSYFENGNEYNINFTNDDLECLEIYNSFGIDISNQVYGYVESTKQGNIYDVTSKISSKYLMINYSEPQYFNFYNNENLEIENAEILLYNLDNGTLYYSEENSDEYKVWTIDTAKQPFYENEYLYDEIKKVI